MPKISDLVEKRKFVKKSYRPWDLSGTGTIDGQTELEEKIHVSNSQDTVIEMVEQNQVVEIISNSIPNTFTDTTGNVTGNISGNNEVTTEELSGNNKVTSLQNRDNNEITTRKQLGNTTGNSTDNITSVSQLTETIKKLIGIQKNIFLYIVDTCTARGELDTGIIQSSELANVSNCTIGSAKTSLVRLIEKQLVIRHEGRACKGGHMILGISREIQAATIQAQRNLYYSPKQSVTGNNIDNIMGNNVLSSSNSIKNITTTTDLPDDWKRIDFTPLKTINFGLIEIKNIYKKCPSNIDFMIVQDSINQFAFGLTNNKERYKNMTAPAGVLVKNLIDGNPWVENGYVSPEELLKREKENRISQILEQRFKSPKFIEWFNSLTEEARDNIVPQGVRDSTSYLISKNVMQKEHATRYFDHEIWPQILLELKDIF